jgi:tetratricopeptide (TPR) repeat protein
LLAVTVAGWPAPVLPAQSQPALATFQGALAAGEKLLARNKPAEARAAFDAALGLAKTAAERADAMIGAARTFSDHGMARARLAEVEKLPGLSAAKKAEAKLAAADTYVREGKPSVAAAEYTLLLDGTDLLPAARSTAFAARANTYLRSAFNSAADITAALKDLDSATKVEGAPDPNRAAAYLQLAALQHGIGRREPAEASLAVVLALPGATDDQKAQALIASGNISQQNKAPDKARAAWSRVVELMAGADYKLIAYRSLAQSFLAEEKLDQAQAELAKALQLPGLGDPDKATLFDELGGIQLGSGSHAAARESYSKIGELPNAGAIQRMDAVLNVGKTYAAEKNYPAARETWEKLAASATSHAVDALRLIGMTHAEEKNYPAARAAFERWLALPLDNYWKEDAWLLVGQVHELERNWTGARDAFQKLLQDPQTRSSRKVQAVLGQIRTHQVEKNPEAVLQGYAALPDAFKSTRQSSPAELSEVARLHTAVSQHLRQVAGGYGKEKATLPSAVSLYRVAEKLQQTDSDRASVCLELGDVLLAHGMPAEAKAEYQKVVALGNALSDQKQKAASKLKEIDEKSKAG